MDPQAVLVSNLDLIERIVNGAARRGALRTDESEDFRSWVMTRLVEDEYSILRKFENRSSLRTYLTVVIGNLMRDYQVQHWGRWRSSVEARKLGPVAVRLETLLYRDGHTLQQAMAILRSAGVNQSERELVFVATRLPVRRRPREVGADPLEDEIASSRADDNVQSSEHLQAWQTAAAKLELAMSTLANEDRLILRMRYWEGLSVAQIARSLNVEQKSLYRRIEKQLRVLRVSMEANGVDRGLIAGLLSAEIVR